MGRAFRIEVLIALAVNAVALPALLAYNLPPSSTYLNQAAALIGWGAFLTVLAGSMPRGASRWSWSPPTAVCVARSTPASSSRAPSAPS